MIGRTLLLLAATSAALPPVHGQTYRVGDIVDDFELPNRLTGGTSRLSDYAGHVILIEWFAYWCPFCNAAAAELDPGIIRHYQNLGGTANGLPFLRLGMNLQADRRASDTAGTNAFISAHQINPVLEDTSRVVARRFVPGGGQPIFAIINGIADSPSHRQWEIIDIRSGYLTTSTPIQDFRTAIDSVQAAPSEPSDTARIQSFSLTASGALRFQVAGNNRDEIQLRHSIDLMNWTPLGTPIPASPEGFLEITPTALGAASFIQAVRAP
jgi:thiol-disulfide isomerase/thioredoxin